MTVLDDSLKREGVKAGGAALALTTGSPTAASLSIALGVAVEALSLLGDKRTAELFNSELLVDEVSAKIKQSDDFAGFVFSVWQKHNLESSAVRRVF